MQLPFADIHREDLGGPVLKQAIGEAARGGAHIQADLIADIQGEEIQGFFQFFAAAPDKPIRCRDRKYCIHRKFLPWFNCRLAIRADRSGQDQALGLGAAFRQVLRYK